MRQRGFKSPKAQLFQVDLARRVGSREWWVDWIIGRRTHRWIIILVVANLLD
jgi:hypothetical protein